MSTEKINFEDVYNDLFLFYLKNKNYKQVLFTGTLGGGFPSIKYATLYNAIAIVSNSQLYLEKYNYFNKPNTGLLTKIKKNNDILLYKNKSIENILKQNTFQKIIIYQNKYYTRHYINHFLKVKKYCLDNNLNKCIFIEVDEPQLNKDNYLYKTSYSNN